MNEIPLNSQSWTSTSTGTLTASDTITWVSSDNVIISNGSNYTGSLIYEQTPSQIKKEMVKKFLDGFIELESIVGHVVNEVYEVLRMESVQGNRLVECEMEIDLNYTDELKSVPKLLVEFMPMADSDYKEKAINANDKVSFVDANGCLNWNYIPGSNTIWIAGGAGTCNNMNISTTNIKIDNSINNVYSYHSGNFDYVSSNTNQFTYA